MNNDLRKKRIEEIKGRLDRVECNAAVNAFPVGDMKWTIQELRWLLGLTERFEKIRETFRHIQTNCGSDLCSGHDVCCEDCPDDRFTDALEEYLLYMEGAEG